MTKKYLYLFLFLISLVSVDAVLINEIYPNPIGSETYGEFIELYNPNNYSVDISNWFIEDHNSIEVIIPDNTIMLSESYYLISDTNFSLNKDDASWPDSDLEDSMSLLGTDSGLMLKNGSLIIDLVGYGNTNISLGTPAPNPSEGLSVQRINNTGDNFNDFIIGIPNPLNSLTGTEVELTHDIELNININNSNPEILLITLSPDDSPENGYQLIPEYGQDKELTITAQVGDNNSYIDIAGVSVTLYDQTIDLNFSQGIDNLTAEYNGTLLVPSSLSVGAHNLTIRVTDQEGLQSEQNITFEMLGLLHTSINTNQLDFQVNPGDFSPEQDLIITNQGNIDVNFKISGTDLINESFILPVNSINFKFLGFTDWLEMGYNSLFINSNLVSGLSQTIKLRFFAPAGTEKRNFEGNITLVTLAA